MTSILDLCDLLRFAPDKWFGSERRIHVACYQTLRRTSPQGAFAAGGLSVTPAMVLDNAVAYLFEGSVRCLMPDAEGGFLWSKETGLQARAPDPEFCESAPATWFIVVQPYYEGMDMGLIRKRLQSTAAMCALLYGRGLLHRLHVENVCSGKDVHVSGERVVQITLGPCAMYGSYAEDAPITSVLPEYESFIAAYQALGNNKRSRLDLALRWYERSMRSEGIASFLDAWIAIEVAVAPSGKCVAGVRTLLARHYAMRPADVQSLFKVDELYVLRNAIVHGGFIQDICPFVVDYAGLVFRDLVRAILGQPLVGHAKRALERPTAKAVDWRTLQFKDAATPSSDEDQEISCIVTGKRTWNA